MFSLLMRYLYCTDNNHNLDVDLVFLIFSHLIVVNYIEGQGQ